MPPKAKRSDHSAGRGCVRVRSGGGWLWAGILSGALTLAGSLAAPAGAARTLVDGPALPPGSELAVRVLNGELMILRPSIDGGIVVGSGIDPLWSADGRWLAFLVPRAGGSPSGGALWVASANGRDDHRVAGIGPIYPGQFAWSPARDELAVATSGSAFVRQTGAGGVYLVTPNGRPRRLLPSSWQVDGSVLWAPDGRSLALSRIGPVRRGVGASASLYVVRVPGGAPRRLVTARGEGLLPAAWWPDGRGLLYWLDPLFSGSVAADGLPLESLPLGRAPKALGVTLPYPTSLSLAGDSAAIMLGPNREVWDDKAVALCALAAARCRKLSPPSGDVALDPALAESGALAFVTARSRAGAGGWPPPSDRHLGRWLKSERLWIAAPNRRARVVRAAGSGIAAPAWSADDRYVLYVRDRSLYVLDTATGRATLVVGTFAPLGTRFGYYGYVAWGTFFAWHTQP